MKPLAEDKFKMLREYLGLLENMFLVKRKEGVLIFALLLRTCSTFIFSWSAWCRSSSFLFNLLSINHERNR
uniref:Uncharacterized protein n=1 Tax=Picea glauca TaxID=3330 RepID=A0A101LYV3_PICGL|nr:hypothetical protein ABT39_MTgene4891 [Picea glauca]